MCVGVGVCVCGCAVGDYRSFTDGSDEADYIDVADTCSTARPLILQSERPWKTSSASCSWNVSKCGVET